MCRICPCINIQHNLLGRLLITFDKSIYHSAAHFSYFCFTDMIF